MRITPGPETQERLITIAQAEADYFAGLTIDSSDNEDRRQQLQKPMGFCNQKWEELKAMMQPGDELWEICTDEESWDELMGWHYLELRREGKRIASLVLAMN